MPQDAISKALGKRVRTLRKGARVSIEELADRASLHANTIGAIERGQSTPTFVVLKQVADALEIEVSTLVDLSGEESDARLLARIVRHAKSLRGPELRRLLRMIDAARD